MTKCKCDGCGWQGDESEVEDIDLNEWASYSDFDAITCLPVGECACGAPVYTLAADKAWALAKEAPLLLQALKDLLEEYENHTDNAYCELNTEFYAISNAKAFIKTAEGTL